MRELFRGPVVGDPALVQDQDGIVELQVGKGVGHGERDPALAAGDVVQEVYDFPLGAWDPARW